MEHNIYREQPLFSRTVSTLLPSNTDAPYASGAQQVTKSASSSLHDHLASRGLASATEELAVLKPLHNRAQVSPISSESPNTAPARSSEAAPTLLNGVLDAPTLVAKGNHSFEGDTSVKSDRNLTQTPPPKQRISSAGLAAGPNTSGCYTIQEEPLSRSQPSSIPSSYRKASSHYENSTSIAFSREVSVCEDHNSKENILQGTQSPATKSTARFYQGALASIPSFRGLSAFEGHNIQHKISPRSISRTPSHQENASSSKADPFKTHSLRKPVLRSQPAYSDPVSIYSPALATTES